MRKNVMALVCTMSVAISGCGLEILGGIAVYEATRRAMQKLEEQQRKDAEEKINSSVAEETQELKKEPDPRAPRANCIRVDGAWQCK